MRKAAAIALPPANCYAAGAMTGERWRDRQAVRLLSIFLLLLQGSRLTVHELAARFKTRRETIYRDLRTLAEVGIPVERLVGVRLPASKKLRGRSASAATVKRGGVDGWSDERWSENQQELG